MSELWPNHETARYRLHQPLYRGDSCARVRIVDYKPGAVGRAMKWFPLIILGAFALLILSGLLDLI